MTETKRSWSIPVGVTPLITAFSGAQQILNHVPAKGNKVIIDITITEISDK